MWEAPAVEVSFTAVVPPLACTWGPRWGVGQPARWPFGPERKPWQELLLDRYKGPGRCNVPSKLQPLVDQVAMDEFQPLPPPDPAEQVREHLRFTFLFGVI